MFAKMLFLSVALTTTHVSASQLLFKVDNLRNSDGMVLISVFAEEEGFPSEAKHAYKTMKLKLKSNSVQFTLRDLPEGQYALAFVHDENSNGKMDQNVLGMPKEGFAFSNNAKVRFGPPAFQDAAIEVKDAETESSATMKYF